MSLNEILTVTFVVFGALLIVGITFRVLLYYRDQAKTLKEEIENKKGEFVRKLQNMKEDWDIKIREKTKLITERDREIERLNRGLNQVIEEMKQKTGEYDKAFRDVSEVVTTLEADVQSRDDEIERLKQELKPRDEAVKAPPHKSKKSKKQGK
ncbi:hypothetical protein [Bartonella grahamii]|uniref:hypothetical protein n=1 Tax=Bartonella grahamii TaxID=33045 RepID=UPI002E7ADEBD|nr:hypothetical protein [Bartonella grahamii]